MLATKFGQKINLTKKISWQKNLVRRTVPVFFKSVKNE